MAGAGGSIRGAAGGSLIWLPCNTYDHAWVVALVGLGVGVERSTERMITILIKPNRTVMLSQRVELRSLLRTGGRPWLVLPTYT